jgi:hypothetical protein
MKLIDFVDNKLKRAESRTNLFVTSMLAGLVLLIAAGLYVMPRFEVSYHGIWYRQLAEDPFNFSEANPLQFRILTPLIAFLLRIPFRAYVLVPLFFTILFLGAIYYWCRKRRYAPVEAFGMSALIAFSSPIFIPLVSPGYSDVVSYFFIFLCFVTVTNKRFFIPIFSIALFNHEMVLFLLPALFSFSILLSEAKFKESLVFVLSTVLACIPYLLFRYYVGQHAHIEYDFEFYTSLKNIEENFKLVVRLAPAGAFFAFKLFWFIILFFLIQAIQQKMYQVVVPVLLIVLFTSLQLLFAFDVTRLFSVAFMAILLSADYMRNSFNKGKFGYYLWMMIGLNFFIPQYFVSKEGLNDIFPPIVYAFEYIIKMYL